MVLYPYMHKCVDKLLLGFSQPAKTHSFTPPCCFRETRLSTPSVWFAEEPYRADRANKPRRISGRLWAVLVPHAPLLLRTFNFVETACIGVFYAHQYKIVAP